MATANAVSGPETAPCTLGGGSLRLDEIRPTKPSGRTAPRSPIAQPSTPAATTRTKSCSTFSRSTSRCRAPRHFSERHRVEPPRRRSAARPSRWRHRRAARSRAQRARGSRSALATAARAPRAGRCEILDSRPPAAAAPRARRETPRVWVQLAGVEAHVFGDAARRQQARREHVVVIAAARSGASP